MAIYYTWFVASDGTLDQLFPGWQPAGSELDPSEEAPLAVHEALGPGPEPIAPVIPPQSDYDRYLEETTPRGLAGLPHLRWKGLPHDFIDQVTEELCPGSPVELVRRGPDYSAEQVPVVQGFSLDVVAALAQLSDPQLKALTMELSGTDDEFFDDGVSPIENDYLHLLKGLRELARIAVQCQGWVCLFTTL